MELPFLWAPVFHRQTHTRESYIFVQKKNLFSAMWPYLLTVDRPAPPCVELWIPFSWLGGQMVVVGWVRWWRMLPAARLVSIFIVSQAAKRPVWNNDIKITWVFLNWIWWLWFKLTILKLACSSPFTNYERLCCRLSSVNLLAVDWITTNGQFSFFS